MEIDIYTFAIQNENALYLICIHVKTLNRCDCDDTNRLTGKKYARDVQDAETCALVSLYARESCITQMRTHVSRRVRCTKIYICLSLFSRMTAIGNVGYELRKTLNTCANN